MVLLLTNAGVAILAGLLVANRLRSICRYRFGIGNPIFFFLVCQRAILIREETGRIRASNYGLMQEV